MEGFDKKLPNFGHRFESAATQGIGIHRYPAPADDAQPLGVRRNFNGGAGFLNHRRRKKGEADPEHFGQLNALLLSAGTEEGLWERSEQTGAVAAGSIRVDASTVGEAL
jgi:hypothetical protein